MYMYILNPSFEDEFLRSNFKKPRPLLAPDLRLGLLRQAELPRCWDEHAICSHGSGLSRISSAWSTPKPSLTIGNHAFLFFSILFYSFLSYPILTSIISLSLFNLTSVALTPAAAAHLRHLCGRLQIFGSHRAPALQQGLCSCALRMYATQRLLEFLNRNFISCHSDFLV